MRTRLALVALALLASLTMASSAFASAPPPDYPAVLAGATFETTAASDTLQVYNVFAGQPAGPATWGRVSQQHSPASSFGLWCAGQSATWGNYPSGTRGLAVLAVPDATGYYESSIRFSYIEPSAEPFSGGINPFSVNWVDGSETPTSPVTLGYSDPFLPLAPVWSTVVLPRGDGGGIPPLSAGWFRFQFVSREGAGNGAGPTIDDVKAVGYKFGAVNALTAQRHAESPSTVDLSWTKPHAPGLSTPDPRPIWYRVWRHDLTSGTWAEVSVSRSTAVTLTDTSADPGHSLQYAVQGYDATGESVWGVLATSPTVGTSSQQYAIVPSATAGGAISPPTTQSVDWGASRAFTITPDPGYKVLDVKVDGASVGALRSYTFTSVVASHTIAASFSLLDASSKDIVRLEGANRYATAVAIARDGFPGWGGVRHLVLASGDNNHQPDALTAAGLAGAYNCPLLLVPTNYLDADTRAAIASMPSGLQVHIVGGTPAVSTKVSNLVKGISRVRSIDRVSGTERYATAAAVARKMKSVLGSGMPRTALLTNGSSTELLLDPLIASTASNNKHFPVLLLTNSIVPNATRLALKDLGLSTRYIVGSTTAVNEGVRSTLGVSAGNRIAGPDLPGDAAAFATRARAEGWLTGSTVGFAASVPDAATGGAAMGKKSGPMLLVLPTTLPTTTSDYLTANKASISGGWLFGGPPAVSDAVLTELKGFIN
jgi:hypothetical protein